MVGWSDILVGSGLHRWWWWWLYTDDEVQWQVTCGLAGCRFSFTVPSSNICSIISLDSISSIPVFLHQGRLKLSLLLLLLTPAPSTSTDLQINNVDCVTKPSNKITEPNVSEQIVSYYQVNHIDTFTYSRPFHQGTKDSNNEFATLCIEKTTLKTTYSLPGVLRDPPLG